MLVTVISVTHIIILLRKYVLTYNCCKYTQDQRQGAGHAAHQANTRNAEAAMAMAK